MRRNTYWAGRVRGVREAYNLSVIQLASVMAVTRNAVYAWERGEATPDPFHRTVLLKLWQVSHDPVRFHATFEAIRRARAMQPAVPEDVPASARDGGPALENLLAKVGLGVILEALFSGETKTNSRRRTRR